jgi:hypothetical protein
MDYDTSPTRGSRQSFEPNSDASAVLRILANDLVPEYAASEPIAGL